MSQGEGGGKPRATIQHLELVGLENHGDHKYYNRDHGPLITADTNLKCPSEYHKETKKCWKAIVPTLIQMGVLTEPDLPTLKQLFDAHDDYVRARENYKAYTVLFDSSNIQDVVKMVDIQRKLFSVMDAARDRFNKIGSRFGITPTERSRLPINQESKDEDPLQVILEK